MTRIPPWEKEIPPVQLGMCKVCEGEPADPVYAIQGTQMCADCYYEEVLKE